MPTYTCTAKAGFLDTERKANIARAVTLAHAEITGAPTHFAQVIFKSVAEDNHFVGGVPLIHEHVWVYGRIRSGRSALDRKTLIRRLTADVATAAGIEHFGVWVYLLELPPAMMVEFGHILPDAGDEADWTAALPETDRIRMETIKGRLG